MNTQTCDVEVRGLSNDRDLDLVLGQRFQKAVCSKRWEKGLAVVSFENYDDAQEFVRASNGRPFRGGATITAKLLTPPPATPAADFAAPAPRARPPVAGAAQPGSAVNTRPVRQGRDMRRPAPYHFVPVATKLAGTAEPVLHDRLDPRAWSGELHLTFRALTHF